MHRTQVLIEDWQYEHLKTISLQKGKSISAVLREIISALVDRDASTESLSAICGLGEDRDGTGRDHDRLLYGKAEGND